MKTLTLEKYVEEIMERGMPRRKALERAYADFIEGKIRLSDPSPPRDFIEYLARADYSLWYWSMLVFVALAVLTIYGSEALPVLKYLRYVVGSIMVLFLPGASLIEALYPREEDLSPLERLALSIGLSLAVVPLIGLILNYTPWGIRLNPIVISLSLFIVILGFIGCWRKYTLVRTSIYTIT